MAGHSKWVSIKHKKAATDAKRGKAWFKLNKAIIVAAKDGADPEASSRLRTAIADAKAVSMPKNDIERAIKNGACAGAAKWEPPKYVGHRQYFHGLDDGIVQWSHRAVELSLRASDQRNSASLRSIPSTS